MGMRTYPRCKNIWCSRRESQRKKENQILFWVCSFTMYFIDKELSSYEEAVEQKEWKDAMIKEYQSIMKNDVWDVVQRPKGKSV